MASSISPGYWSRVRNRWKKPASVGLALTALFFVWRDRYPRLANAALIFALSLGSLFSLVRMAQGAHFFSHNLWTAVLCWLVCLVLYDLLLYRPAPQSLAARSAALG